MQENSLKKIIVEMDHNNQKLLNDIQNILSEHLKILEHVIDLKHAPISTLNQLIEILVRHQNRYEISPDLFRDAMKHFYEKSTGYSLDLENPRTFNEKIQWAKLYESTPEKTLLSDKYLVRKYLEERIDKKYMIPLLAVYDKPEDIDFDSLPNKFVIKTNHASQQVIVVRDKNAIDKAKIIERCKLFLRINYAFMCGFEFHYMNIKPKILIEQYLEDASKGLMDYKIFCFNGKPSFLWVDQDRFTEHKRTLFDLSFNPVQYKINTNYQCIQNIEKPKNYEIMIQMTRELCRDFNHVRVDWYNTEDNLYFGEFTFTSSSGTEDFWPKEFEDYVSNLYQLPKYKYNVFTGQYFA